MVTRIAEGSLLTKFGEFHEILYYNGQKESIALIMGDVEDKENVLCRVHSSCISAHILNSIECDCREQFEISQKMIQDAGLGILIWLDQEGKANGHYALLKSIEEKKKGLTQTEAYESIGFEQDARNFTQAAEILNDIKVKSIRLLTNNPKKIDAISKFGTVVTGIKKIIIPPSNIELRKTMEGKIKDGHLFNL